MKLAIVIGASRGLGAGLCESLLEKEYSIAGFSRTEPLFSTHPSFHYFKMDVTQTEELSSVFNEAMQTMKANQASELLFIYNAGIVQPIGQMGTLKANDISRHYAVNVIAPAVLTNAFIYFSQQLLALKRMALITSGAANRPISGWTCYSSAKASMNMLVQGISEEQSAANTPIHICGFNPGIMDTDMQADIRNQTKQDFPQLERFKAFHKEGRLRSADAVAEALTKCLTSTSFPDGEITDVETYL